ncbi:MAG: transglutaminase-like domain-containing protein [Peptococcaceae bacterium]|nr:transglutaminase-like domain-containing protein [Peptococcaceae bacterium]
MKPVFIRRNASLLLAVILICASCGILEARRPENGNSLNYSGNGAQVSGPGQVLDIAPPEVPLAEKAAASGLAMPKAQGAEVYSNTKVAFDVSNTGEGYVMVKYTGTSQAALKVLLTCPSGVTYTYTLNNQGDYEVYPLSEGSGSYKVGAYQNIGGTKYSTLFSKTISVKLKDEFGPFLLPNQYVNYKEDSEAVKKAAELTKNSKDELEKVSAVYGFVINHLTYDQEKAKTVKSGYLPVVDDVLKEKKGICFDYAALMAAMLRSQGVPTKLVVGYTGQIYHAWLNTYSEESGWVEGIIFFDGTTWKLMDPTFASSAKSDEKIMEYISDDDNYTAKYLY